MDIDPEWFKDRLNNLDPTDPKWAEKLELDLNEQTTGTRPAVRHDCAFCHRERTPADDNHAPDCSYWSFFSGGRP